MKREKKNSAEVRPTATSKNPQLSNHGYKYNPRNFQCDMRHYHENVDETQKAIQNSNCIKRAKCSHPPTLNRLTPRHTITTRLKSTDS